MINYDEFKKVEITIGQIISAKKMDGADKLLILSVDFGLKPKPVIAPVEIATIVDEETDTVDPLIVEESVQERDIRQIVSGISVYFPEPEKLVGTRCAFVTNLEPRKIRGYDSNGMILAVGGEGEPFSLFKMGEEIEPGSKAR
jgi:methionyl-tRNA synthetase